MNRTALVLMVAQLALCQPADARLFKIANGTVVTANSPMFGEENPEEMFGEGFLNFPEPGQSIFADSPPGTLHFVEWRTATPVSVKRIVLQAGGDGCDSSLRTFSNFRLLADVGGNMTALIDEAVPVPYQHEGAFCIDLLARIIDPIVAQDFRAEFVQAPASTGGGPRVVEIEGFTQAICGDATDDAAVTATDALFALIASIGATPWCENCICDATADSAVTATDALAILQSSIGVQDLLNCPPCILAETE